jgi:hypothetical protein
LLDSRDDAGDDTDSAAATTAEAALESIPVMGFASDFAVAVLALLLVPAVCTGVAANAVAGAGLAAAVPAASDAK